MRETRRIADEFENTSRDWHAWHEQYDDASSPLKHRLSTVQRKIHWALPPQLDCVFSIVSFCAGQGTDVIGVLKDYAHAARVRARLVEYNFANVERMRDEAHAAGFDHLEIVRADASYTKVYEGRVPADLVLICGVFGNISDVDIQRTICSLPQLCRTGSTVVWTRSRRVPDVTTRIREWFGDNEFDEISFTRPLGCCFLSE